MSFSIYNTETQLEQANSTIRVLHSQLADERKQLAEYKQRAEAAEAKLRELEMQEPVAYFQEFHGIHEQVDSRFSDNDGIFPLYAKPFHKQEDK